MHENKNNDHNEDLKNIWRGQKDAIQHVKYGKFIYTLHKMLYIRIQSQITF